MSSFGHILWLGAQFFIQLVYKPHFGTWIFLFGPFCQLRVKKMFCFLPQNRLPLKFKSWVYSTKRIYRLTLNRTGAWAICTLYILYTVWSVIDSMHIFGCGCGCTSLTHQGRYTYIYINFVTYFSKYRFWLLPYWLPMRRHLEFLS